MKRYIKSESILNNHHEEDRLFTDEEIEGIEIALDELGVYEELSKRHEGNEDDYFQIEDIQDIGNGWIRLDIRGYNDNTGNDYISVVEFNTENEDVEILD